MSSEEAFKENEDSIDWGLMMIIYSLYFFLWMTIYLIALKLEFGAVYFLLSALLFIWKHTRSETKTKGELSAYSVFNPKCEAILGSISSEQLEKEMGFPSR